MHLNAVLRFRFRQTLMSGDVSLKRHLPISAIITIPQHIHHGVSHRYDRFSTEVVARLLKDSAVLHIQGIY